MTIICGTDFSPRAEHAMRVAARLAHHWHDKLMLLHAADLTMYSMLPDVVGLVSDFQGSMEGYLQDALIDLVSKVAIDAHDVECRLVFAPPALALSGEAEGGNARLIVVGSTGLRGLQRILLGSVAEKLLYTSRNPVLVVGENSKGLEEWASGAKRPLRALVAMDESSASRAMFKWLATLRAEEVDVTLLHFYQPPKDVSPTASVEAIRHSIAERIELEMGPLGGKGKIQWVVEPLNGEVRDALQHEGEKMQPDLLVMGSHHRGFLDRLVHRSNSRGTMHVLDLPLLCVPSSVRG